MFFTRFSSHRISSYVLVISLNSIWAQRPVMRTSVGMKRCQILVNIGGQKEGQTGQEVRKLACCCGHLYTVFPIVELMQAFLPRSHPFAFPDICP